MNCAIGSKVDLESFDEEIARQYRACVEDLLDHEKVKKLDLWEQHNHTSRLQHCLNVSYYSFLICWKLGWDYRSAARAGLLHDLYFYDWRTKKALRSNHAAWHPRVTLENEKGFWEINPCEGERF